MNTDNDIFRLAIYADFTAARSRIDWSRSEGPGLNGVVDRETCDVVYHEGTSESLIEAATRDYLAGCNAATWTRWRTAKTILSFFDAVPLARD